MSDTTLESTAEAPETGVPLTPAQEAIAKLKDLHPNIVSDDAREGYEGLVVYADSITEVAKSLRDDLGFNYLSSVTGVDLIEDGKWRWSIISIALAVAAALLSCGPRSTAMRRLCRHWCLFSPALNFRSARPTICMASSSRGIPICAAS